MELRKKGSMNKEHTTS